MFLNRKIIFFFSVVLSFSVAILNFPINFYSTSTYEIDQSICKSDYDVQHSYFTIDRSFTKIINFYQKIDLIIKEISNQIFNREKETSFYYPIINLKNYFLNPNSRAPPQV